ncbi:MAG: glutamine synthetase beta-grasp domain-containing protein, partial [Chloroflexota bacterium]
MEEERAAEREFVLRSSRENDVKFIRLWFTDILGSLKGFAITVDDLEDAMAQGVGFDGSSIEGFVRIDESDMRAFPDPATFSLLPWRPRQNAVARMFCDIRTPRGEPFSGDPRYALKRNLERLARAGFTYYVGPELEFFYLKDATPPAPLDQRGYFAQLSSPPAAALRRD